MIRKNILKRFKHESVSKFSALLLEETRALLPPSLRKIILPLVTLSKLHILHGTGRGGATRASYLFTAAGGGNQN